MTAGSILVPQIIPLRFSTPGKAKHEIDTNTLIEIKSDTPDVTIYYTIDGSKPQLFRKLNYRDHNTFKYNGPITLPDGKITIKALAVTKDGRESTVVTKVFIVEYVTPNVHVPDEDENENFLEDLISQEMEDESSHLKKTNKEASAESKFHLPDVALELQGLSKEKPFVPSQIIGTHLLKNYLNTSSDGEKSNSATRMPQSQMALCNKCQTMVPRNSPTCIVCEALMTPRLQEQGSICQKGKVVYCVCGAGNPICITQCVVCGIQFPEAQMSNSLQTRQQSVISLPPSIPNLLEKKEQGTQTIGLYYPSIKFLEKKESELLSQKEKSNETNYHKPLLTAISPGRGYWRKQLDHVCAHLRSYTQNNLEFRTLIGEPQMGKLISATVHKDSYQVSLQINYALAINKDILTNKPLAFGYHELSPSKAGRAGLYESQAGLTFSILAREESQRVPSPSEKVKRMMKTGTCLEKEEKLTTESRQLLKEVGPKGQGRPFVVEQLIDEGADPNCTNSEDQAALTLAVLNRHHGVIPILVQKGANVDHQSRPLNNTALHEAVLLGLEGWECVDALLGCNADIKKKNSRGLSACDLALKSGIDKIVSLFAGKLGKRMLDKTSTTQAESA
ncbi:double zinc ribbon and ankyrin repeat-containing protein 1 isoform X2 [Podarcis raffonei]|uniref:double zinc ribbon and ankyrin repeat-containing protein 1 isoform X2 n=1 Tax=Podarcis raffonei TaxID=65483 RepID=UPI0023290AB8|nr:double zinc ribbon and ankyrin repeat-containing protein 1 isoform X2 [Podarcis raffonei]